MKIIDIITVLSGVLTIINFLLSLSSRLREQRGRTFVFGVLTGAFSIIFFTSLFNSKIDCKCPEDVNLTIDPVRNSDMGISGKIENLVPSQFDSFKVVVYYKYRSGDFYIHPITQSYAAIHGDSRWKITKVKTRTDPEKVYAFIIPIMQDCPESMIDLGSFCYCAEVNTEFLNKP